MKVGARNQLKGRVTAIKCGEVLLFVKAVNVLPAKVGWNEHDR